MRNNPIVLVFSNHELISISKLNYRIAKNDEWTNLPISIGMGNVLSVISDKIVPEEVPGGGSVLKNHFC